MCESPQGKQMSACCAVRSRAAGEFRAARRQRTVSEFPWDVTELLRRCGRPEPLPMGGCILRGALTEPEQRWLYQTLHAMPEEGCEELMSLRATASRSDFARYNPDNRPQAWVTWVHPYTRASNARRRPDRLLSWAEQLMHALAPESRGHAVDSMLAQMYAAGGSLLRHRDEDLSWGLGVSLGAAAEFDCLPDGGEAQRVLIASGVRRAAAAAAARAARAHAPALPRADPSHALRSRAGRSGGRVWGDATRGASHVEAAAGVVGRGRHVWREDARERALPPGAHQAAAARALRGACARRVRHVTRRAEAADGKRRRLPVRAPAPRVQGVRWPACRAGASGVRVGCTGRYGDEHANNSISGNDFTSDSIFGFHFT
jgi:alkylated DNA repair dioxygenase AlkB